MTHLNRRDFLKRCAGAAAFATLPPSATLAERREPSAGRYEATDAVAPLDYKHYLHDGDTRGFGALEALDRGFEKVLREARETVVTGDAPAVWYVYNMGYIVKTRHALFSIDLVHRRDAEFAPLLDFALITHNHGDHWRRGFYGAMNGAHKTVITNFLDNYGATHWGGAADDNGCGYTRAVREFRIRDVSIRTSLVDHNHVLVDYTTAFEIRTGNFVLYHSGDCGNAAKLGTVSPRPDLWIVHPFCGMDVVEGATAVKPKCVALSHLNELGHQTGRSRWTWSQGRDAADRLESAGTKAVVPYWGDRIV